MADKKIMLHIIMPNQVSGPNNAARLIAHSYLNKKYDFDFAVQEFHAGGKINIRLIRELKRQIKEYNPDLIHLSGMQSSGFHAVLAARLAGCKNILLTIRGFSGDSLSVGRFRKFVFTSIIEPATLKLCRRFFTVCHEASLKPMVIKASKKYIGTIHNSAPNISINTENARRSVREEFGFGSDDFIIAVSGRLVYDKGLSYICDAFNGIEDKSVKIVIMGEGNYMQEVKERLAKQIAEKRAFVTGKRDDVIRVLCGCDVFLFATLHENLSNALLEAMSVGLPVIATRVGGNVEVVEDGVNGFLINPQTSEEIVEKIYLLKSDKTMLDNFSKESKRIIQEKFSQEILLKQLDEVYTEMLS